MQYLYTCCFFLIGLVFGSFYNVVGYRLPNGESLINPPSHCPKCKHELKWYELIPVVSFLFLGGKCKFCKKPIDKFYPFIELLTGLLFALSFYLFDFSYKFVIMLIISSIFSIVLVSDINYLMIPDEITILASVFVIIVNIISLGFIGAFKMFLSGLLLFIIMFLIMQFGNLVFKKESLGGADIKLMFFIGLVLSPVEGIFCIFLASILALPISIIKIMKDKNNVIPYGPFLLLALILIVIFGIDNGLLLNMC